MVHAGQSSKPVSAARTLELNAAASAIKPEAEQAGAEEDKENDHAAVTAVIWKELAELSAAQAKLKVAFQMNAGFCCSHRQLG